MNPVTAIRRSTGLTLATGAVAALVMATCAVGAAATTPGASGGGVEVALTDTAGGGSTTVAMRQAAGFSQQQIQCSCVIYVRSRTGLPGGPTYAKDYTESKMRSFGYRRVTPTAGAIFVWDANQKGAGSAGHMAIIRSASYNSKTKKWAITVDHANWGGCGIRTTQFTTWGDLYGVNAYVR
jgi:surface antigen